MARTRWGVDASKFLDDVQVAKLKLHLEARRDLAIARGSATQPIKDYYLIMGILFAGLRVTETTKLQLSDLHDRQISVRNSKGDVSRTVLLTIEGRRLYSEWLRVRSQLGFSEAPESPLFPSRFSRPYSRYGIERRVKSIFRELEFPEGLSTHSLRHTNCTLLIRAGVPITAVRDNLGHHSIAVTNTYAHSCEDLAEVRLIRPTGARSWSAKRLDSSPVKRFTRGSE